MDIGNANEDDQAKAVMLFGRDIRKVPCFKRSIVSGIYGGIAAGLLAFMFTSRAKLATNVALGSYMGVAVMYWCYCRYNYVTEKYALQDLQNCLRQAEIGDAEIKEAEHRKELINT